MSKKIRNIEKAYYEDNQKEVTPISETGTWDVFINGSEVYMESSDFTHDVWLKISGDFESVEQKILYAKEIVHRLNKFNN